jgi:hypothetical protein
MRALLATLALAAVGCGDDDEALTIELTLGHEDDAFSRAPAVTRVDVTAASLVSGFVATASASPGGSFDLGEVPSEEIYELAATGFTGDGEAVVGGRSLAGVSLTSGDRVPLFVQRIGGWERPPGEMPASRRSGVAVAAGERYLLTSGGSPEGDAEAGDMEVYDLFTLEGRASPALPRTPATMLERDAVLLLIGDDGATWLDLVGGASAPAEPPAGLGSFGPVEGGAVIQGEGGTSWVVGATRSSSPTPVVLRVDADGSLELRTLSAPRAGAAATWLPGVGLVVVGGSAEAAGVEVVAANAPLGKALDFPPDATRGAGATLSGDDRVLVFGGDLDGDSAPTRLIDARCAKGCAAEDLPADAAPPAVVHVSSSWGIAPGIALVIAEDQAAPATRTFLVDVPAKTTTELPLREPRAGAVAVPTPNGSLMLLGGRLTDGGPALRVEMFFVE